MFLGLQRTEKKAESKLIPCIFLFELQKEMFLSREELQMSVRGAEDKEMEKQVGTGFACGVQCTLTMGCGYVIRTSKQRNSTINLVSLINYVLLVI